jgi:hypothetical protein
MTARSGRPSVVDRDTWWRYFDDRVYDLKVLPIASHPTHIVIVRAGGSTRAHPRGGLMETFRHGLAIECARLGTLRSAAARS